MIYDDKTYEFIFLTGKRFYSHGDGLSVWIDKTEQLSFIHESDDIVRDSNKFLHSELLEMVDYMLSRWQKARTILENQK